MFKNGARELYNVNMHWVHITTKKIILLSGYRNNFEAMSVVSVERCLKN